MKDLLNKIRQIIKRKKESNYGVIGKSSNKKESNKKPLIAKEKEPNKVRLNRWGFPSMNK